MIKGDRVPGDWGKYRGSPKKKSFGEEGISRTIRKKRTLHLAGQEILQRRKKKLVTNV